MRQGRSLLVLVVIPAIVSLGVTLAVLSAMDAQRASERRVIIMPTHSSTAMLPPLTLPGSDTQEPGATALPDQTASAGCNNPIHLVAGGETLSTIATQYGVSSDDITAVNQQHDPVFNPDFLSIGQQIIIPACGVPTLAPPTNTPVATRDIPTPIATATEPPPGTVRIHVSRVLNPGDITREAVEIVNEGSPVDLQKWTLSNNKGAEFIFPSFRLFTEGGVTIYSGVGENTPISLYWGLTDAVWASGDTVYLYDADGKQQASYVIP